MSIRPFETVEGRGYVRAAWLLILALGILDCLWARRAGLAFVGWTQPAFMLTILLGTASLYDYTGRDRRLADAAHFAALWVTFSIVGVIFTYLAATLAMPLRDSQFLAIDGSLGFHWLAWTAFICGHPWIHDPLWVAYASFLPQITGSILYFADTGQTKRNTELIWIAMLTLILAAVISGLLPAFGPYVDFTKRPTIYFDVVKALRAGGPHTFDLEELTGIIKLPSFHAGLLVILVYVHRPPSRSFMLVWPLNALMLLSIPSEGHHYLVDMIAGGTVATLCILAFRTADPAIRLDLEARDTDGLQVEQELDSQLQPVRSRFRTSLPPT